MQNPFVYHSQTWANYLFLYLLDHIGQVFGKVLGVVLEHVEDSAGVRVLGQPDHLIQMLGGRLDVVLGLTDELLKRGEDGGHCGSGRRGLGTRSGAGCPQL